MNIDNIDNIETTTRPNVIEGDAKIIELKDNQQIKTEMDQIESALKTSYQKLRN